MEEPAPAPAFEQAVYITAKLGGRHLQNAEGYLYFKSKTVATKNRTYWTCLDKKIFSCSSTAITELDSGLIVSRGQHNHGNRLLELKTRAVENAKIEAAAAMPTVVPRTILGKEYFF
jgi:FLYWCH zinc finger domain